MDRRALLATLSAASGAALAGCLGGDDGDSDGEDLGGDTDEEDLGERVEEVALESMSGLPASFQLEQTTNTIASTLEEELGVSTDVNVKEFLTFNEETNNDNRSHHFHIDYHPPFPFFLDPQRILTGYDLRSAGANGRGNVAQYASCEFTELVVDQRTATDPDERRELVHEAFSVASEDIERINLVNQLFRGAYRTDQIEIPEIGEMGITDFNVELMWESRPIEGEDKIMNISPANIDGVAYQATSYLELWSHCVYSALTYFDKNGQLQPNLATDWEISDDGTQYTWHLREDATFHNGEPVTAEDVKWTYEWLDDNNGVLSLAGSWPYESIEVVDDHTVEMNFEEPVGAYLTAHTPMWGIVPSDIWSEAGAEENPADPDIDPDEIVGSGPYQVASFQQEEILDLEPYEDHWIDVEGNLVFRGYHDVEAARRAFMEGEINIMHDIDGSTREILDDEIPDVSETHVAPSFMDWWLVPQNNYGPTKFREFRLAVSQALDRTMLNENLEFGESEPHLYSSFFAPTHPYYPENPDEVLTQIADSPESNAERAREILEEAGWGWDEDGNLHYPPDADLEPLWPEGSEPLEHPEEFPCAEDLPEL